MKKIFKSWVFWVAVGVVAGYIIYQSMAKKEGSETTPAATK